MFCFLPMASCSIWTSHARRDVRLSPLQVLLCSLAGRASDAAPCVTSAGKIGNLNKSVATWDTSNETLDCGRVNTTDSHRLVNSLHVSTFRLQLSSDLWVLLAESLVAETNGLALTEKVGGCDKDCLGR